MFQNHRWYLIDNIFCIKGSQFDFFFTFALWKSMRITFCSISDRGKRRHTNTFSTTIMPFCAIHRYYDKTQDIYHNRNDNKEDK